MRPDVSKILQESCAWSCAWLLPPFRYKQASALGSDFRVLFTWWKPGFRNGSNRANGALPWNFRYGECMSGLSRTLAVTVMFSTSQAYLHASA